MTRLICYTVNQLIFLAIKFCVFVSMGIFAAIYFRRLHNWVMQEQCKVCLYGHFGGNIFSRICFSREYQENNLIYSMQICHYFFDGVISVMTVTDVTVPALEHKACLTQRA